MNQKTLILLMTFGTFNLFGQESSPTPKHIKTESNGIQIFEAPGNHNKVTQPLDSPESSAIKDWSLEECENALYYVDLKIENSKENDSEIEREQLELYETQKSAIIARIKLLSNTTN